MRGRPREETGAERTAEARAPGRLHRRRRPAQDRSRQRVERILAVTGELLAERELEALTTAEIAERAGIPIGSVYHYFTGKEAILAEIAERRIRAVDAVFAERFAADLARLPWRRALERAVDTSVSAFRGDPVYVTVWRTIRTSPVFRSVAAASDESFARALEALPLVRALPRARARVVVPAAIRLSNAFLEWVLEAHEPREAAAARREMKRALVAYLAPDLDRAAEAATARGARPRGAPRHT